MTTTSDAMVRQERLSSNVRALRVPRAGITFNDRWMLIIGGVLMPLGIVFVLFGWWGASHTVLQFEQISYLISGGLLGLAFVISGGFVYFAYWMTLMVRETRTERAELTSVLLRMENLMQDSTQPRTHRSSVGSVALAVAVPTADLVATKTGTMMHRTDCVAVDGRDNLRQVTSTTPGLSACKLCDPLASID